MRDVWPVLMVLGLGGVVLYLLTRPKPVPQVVDRTTGGQCGGSYVGVGVSVPCEYLAAGIKYVANDIAKTAKPLTNEIKTATSGISAKELILTPIAISHVAYNELKRFNPF